MKKLMGMLVAGFLMAACHNNPDNVKTAVKANDHRSDSLANKESITDSGAGIPSRQDADFMVKATAGNQLEVILGQLAQTHSSSPAVKHFGQMMIDQHGEGEREFRGLAVTKHIILPDTISNKQKKEDDDLQKKSGKSFDKAYIALMIKDHKDDIDEYKKAVHDANDSDVRALALKLLPLLQAHLDTVQTLQKTTGS